ncbi:MAG TPA: hypothetical protein VGS97_06320 [Actinocrinis sp.]|uniref:hypothetical protein n=1 Tax=Actinocrinis sp. TaxID=1920516 RepID=UPI002DDD7006|nr:hypothetical protein [Actinocrinis sp.]HEV2343686.1 hypothetical protein [Actinocrinis sp.]
MPDLDETPAEKARWRVNKISDVLARAGLPTYKMDTFATSPLADPVRQAGYAVCSYEDPDCVYVEWIEHWFGRATTGWRYGCERVTRVLTDAGYTVEAPGACGPVGEYRTHDYMRVTYQPKEEAGV